MFPDIHWQKTSSIIFLLLLDNWLTFCFFYSLNHICKPFLRFLEIFIKYFVVYSLETKREALQKLTQNFLCPWTSISFSSGALLIKVQFGLSIGLGWHMTQDDNGRRIIWHNGATNCFASIIRFVPESNQGVVVLTNSMMFVDDIAIWLFQHGPIST